MKKKSIIAFVLILSILLTGNAGVLAQTSMPTFNPDEGVYIFDPDTGDPYYAQNENELYYPASTTKLLTALTAMDYIGDRLGETVIVGEECEMIALDSSRANIVVGESITWKQLLYGLMLPSGNDAAMTIAVNAGRIAEGDPNMETLNALECFIGLMNEKAQALGAVQSSFVNPHGFHDPDHYTTPYDMGLIAKAALEDPTIAEISKKTVYTYTNSSGIEHEWKNSNVLLYPTTTLFSDNALAQFDLSSESSTNPFYNPSVGGGKTGHTDEGGRCLVFSGKENDIRMIGVIFKAEDLKTINTQAKAVLDSSLSEYTHVSVTEEDGIYCEKTVFLGSIFDGFSLNFCTPGAINITVPTDELEGLTQTLVLDEHYLKDHGNFVIVSEDITSDTQVGVLEIRGETYSRTIPIYPGKEIDEFGFWDGLFIVVIMLLIIGIIFIIRNHRRKIRRRKRRKTTSQR